MSISCDTNKCGESDISTVYFYPLSDIAYDIDKAGIVTARIKRKYGKFKREPIVFKSMELDESSKASNLK